jgi:hypothetical protein
MEITGNHLLKFQQKRTVTDLYKSFLIILEDLNTENQISFDKLKRQLPSHVDAVECANYFDDAKMEYIRKKILDAGNGCIRRMDRDLDKFEVNPILDKE